MRFTYVYSSWSSALGRLSANFFTMVLEKKSYSTLLNARHFIGCEINEGVVDSFEMVVLPGGEAFTGINLGC